MEEKKRRRFSILYKGKIRRSIQIYYENGQIHWKGTYLNGDNEFGLLEEWDSLGTMIKRMKCDSMAVCRTFWRPGMPEVNYDTLKSVPTLKF